MIAITRPELVPPPEPLDFTTRAASLNEAERRFKRVARAITERIGELLSAPVLVVDQRGVVAASSESYLAGIPIDLSAEGKEVYRRLPFHIEGQAGEVIVGQPQNGEVISPRLAEALLDLVINQTVLLERRPNQTELKNRFMHDLLRGHFDDEDTILRQAQMLGLDFGPPRAVILIDAKDYICGSPHPERPVSEAQMQRRAQFIIGSVVGYFHLPNDTICAYLGDGEMAVLKASNTKNLVTWADDDATLDQENGSWANLSALRRASQGLLARLRSDTSSTISMGIGRYHPGVCGLARSYQDARAALTLGRRFHGLNGVHCLDQLGIPAFVGVADERTKIELARYLLSPLDHEPELLETLDVFFSEDCSPSATANRLSIHRNTLSYRLEKITSLTGLDPRRFDQAVQIRLALLMRSFVTEAA